MIKTAVLMLLLSTIMPSDDANVLIDHLLVLDQKLEMFSTKYDDPEVKKAIVDARRVIYDILYAPTSPTTVEDIRRAIISASEIIDRL